MEELSCMYCGTPYDNRGNHCDIGTGHWEYNTTTEIWYCCHICRDNNEPCETFFECQEDINNAY